MVSKRVTSQDVAEKAGVSRTTVSLVLNNVTGVNISTATRQKVLKVAQELNYVPNAAAQALAGGVVQAIGLLLIRQPGQIGTDAFLPQTLDGLLQVSQQFGMRLMVEIIEPMHQQKAYLDLARAKRIDGFILSGPCFDDQALSALREVGFPTVLLGQLPGSGFASVDVDNCAAAYEAVAHLIHLGHTQIACITNAPVNYTAAADRLNGYKKALQESNLAYDPDLVRYGDFDTPSGYLRMKELLKLNRAVSAVFIASDELAYGAMTAIREHGLEIPDDIAVVGFDDLPYSSYTAPPLTTVRIPAIDLAKEAGKVLFVLLSGIEPEPRHIILDAALIVRDSCGSKKYPAGITEGKKTRQYTEVKS